MNRMALFFSPLDVWMFRDGRPFDAGDDHYARTLFPPYPLTMQGIVRTCHLLALNVDLNDKKAVKANVGTADDFGALRLRGPFLARHEADGKLTRFFPAPASAAPCDDVRLKIVAPQQPSRFQTQTSLDDRLPMLLFPHAGVEPAKREPGGWLSEDALRQCLKGEPVAPQASEELFTIEHRYGIGMDSSRRATQEGLLYAAEFIRPHDGVGLYVEVGGYTGWPPAGALRLGGEGHGARFEQVETLDWPAPPDPLPARFALYFATPTFFEAGWTPKDWKSFFDGEVTLQTVALNGYESRGGYDLAAGSQKPARRFVPAGSVYYFEAKGEARLRPHLTQNAVTDYGAEIGFGQVWISAW